MTKSKLVNLFVLVWISRSFFDIGSMVTFMNTLPLDRALEAKVFVINSQRSYLGSWSDPYYLMYRVEKN